MRSSLLLMFAALLAGCPSDSPSFVDAADPRDAAVDAPADADIGAATITVRRERNEPGTGEPIADLQVFFIRPDGSYEIVMTGTDGRASAVVVPGSAIVTAHQQTLSGLASYYLTAFTGVGPGFDVIAGAKAPSGAGIAGTATLTWSPVAGALRYQAVASCGYGFPKGTSLGLEIEEGCAAATTATVLVTAFDDTGPIAYSVVPSVDLVAAIGQTLTMPAFTTTLPSATVDYANLPATIDNVDLSLELHEDGRTFGNLDNSFALSPADHTVTAPIVPVGSSTAIRSRFRPNSKGLPVFHLRHHATQQLAHTLDVAAGILPAITFPSFDPAARTLTWEEDAAGAGGRADTIVSRGGWTTAIGGGVDFTLAAPAVPGATSAVLPALPAELADLTPGDPANGYINEIWMIDVVGKNYPAVATDVLPESERIYFDTSVFADEAELWFTGTLPL